MAGDHRPISWLPVSWTVGLMTAYLGITTFINSHVTENYMDEPFHVPMTQRYCKADFTTWDPKITTFPGLYVIGAAYAWVTTAVMGWLGVTLEVACAGSYLRSLNALLAVATIQVAYAISRELQHCQTSSGITRTNSPAQNVNSHTSLMEQQQHLAAVGVALVVGLLPTQLFFAFLFYTDVPSLLFLLLTELLLLRGSTWVAAAAGAAAIGMRQTNAVWVTFLTGGAMLRHVLAAASTAAGAAAAADDPDGSSSRIDDSVDHTGWVSSSDGSSGIDSKDGTGLRKPASKPNHHQQQQAGKQQHTLVDTSVSTLLTTAWTTKAGLARDYCLLLLLPVAFVVFVIWNGGITLGDREAHAPTRHLMQPLYFALFCLANAAPLLLQQIVLHSIRSSVKTAPVLCGIGLLLASTAAAYMVHGYTLLHPYLLADNRHYTFYIWRKIFTRHWLVRYLYVPGYVSGWALLVTALLQKEHWLWVVAYVASCGVTLVPAWLVEFRYFTTPFALAVLHIPPPTLKRCLLVAAAYCLVNGLTLWVFAKRPYTWGDGSVARFMW